MQYDPQALWSADIYAYRPAIAPSSLGNDPDPVTDQAEAQRVLDRLTRIRTQDIPDDQTHIEVVGPDADGWPPSMAEPGGVWLVRLPVFWFNRLHADGYIELTDGSHGFYLESGE